MLWRSSQVAAAGTVRGRNRGGRTEVCRIATDGGEPVGLLADRHGGANDLEHFVLPHVSPVLCRCQSRHGA